MATGFYAQAPFFSHCNASSFPTRSPDASKIPKDVVAGMMIDNSNGWGGNFVQMIELRKKILTFRDVIDLPPCDGSSPIHELVMGTVEDLHNLYPNIVPGNLNSEMKGTSMNQGLAHLHNALKSIGDSWAKNHKWINNSGVGIEDNMENISLEQLGRCVQAKLDYMTNIAKEMFDVMEEEGDNGGGIQSSTIGEVLSRSYSDSKTLCPSPDTPTSVPPELTFAMRPGDFADLSPSRCLLFPLRLQAVGNLMPTDMKCLSFNMSPNLSSQGSSPTTGKYKVAGEQSAIMQEVAEESPENASPERPNESKATIISQKIPNLSSNTMHVARGSAAVPPPHSPPLSTTPPTPTIPPPKGSAPLPQPPMPLTKGNAPPPPPPLGVAKALRPKKATTKLKRSTHMGNMYRILKGKVEGSGLNDKVRRGSRTQIGASARGQQGMADALAEMTKRSAYFQQIEEDVQKHAQSIMDIKTSIDSFQTKDMAELIKFHKHVELHLEQLTDETQVLARFEGFPIKKLESLRTAAALYLKLEGISTSLENWKVTPPLGQLLDKVDSYFNKIKGEVDALERTKDEDSKRLQSHNIHFDFNILVRIKETMVDVSSSCMELALKERRDAKSAANAETGPKAEDSSKAHIKMLWRAFQLAFRVYSFAGGQDDRADTLTRELANEIEADPQQE